MLEIMSVCDGNFIFLKLKMPLSVERGAEVIPRVSLPNGFLLLGSFSTPFFD
jgi:hypothetical protein